MSTRHLRGRKFTSRPPILTSWQFFTYYRIAWDHPPTCWPEDHPSTRTQVSPWKRIKDEFQRPAGASKMAPLWTMTCAKHICSNLFKCVLHAWIIITIVIFLVSFPASNQESRTLTFFFSCGTQIDRIELRGMVFALHFLTISLFYIKTREHQLLLLLIHFLVHTADTG